METALKDEAAAILEVALRAEAVLTVASIVSCVLSCLVEVLLTTGLKQRKDVIIHNNSNS